MEISRLFFDEFARLKKKKFLRFFILQVFMNWLANSKIIAAHFDFLNSVTFTFNGVELSVFNFSGGLKDSSL